MRENEQRTQTAVMTHVKRDDEASVYGCCPVFLRQMQLVFGLRLKKKPGNAVDERLEILHELPNTHFLTYCSSGFILSTHLPSLLHSKLSFQNKGWGSSGKYM